MTVAICTCRRNPIEVQCMLPYKRSVMLVIEHSLDFVLETQRQGFGAATLQRSALESQTLDTQDLMWMKGWGPGFHENEVLDIRVRTTVWMRNWTTRYSLAWTRYGVTYTAILSQQTESQQTVKDIVEEWDSEILYWMDECLYFTRNRWVVWRSHTWNQRPHPLNW